ncbi:PDZ domain-containing protein [uncultured Acetobacteroides sp.]|uniref:PDZ domain-containing protein n=1 Tax=uncultured Acetobacteroides sp. TaxID=1760811 RepID=UPI0029F478FF|nr:PDZ domain-containing protein [uncultured Acetobacteroides sp.]
MTRIIQALTGILLALTLAGAAPDGGPNANPDYNQFRFTDSTKRFTVVKFRFINNLIILPFSVNGSDSLMFVLDTGYGGVLITELQNNRVLTLNQARKVQLQGLGKGKAIEAYASMRNTFSMPGIVGENIDLLVAIDDIFDFSIRTGMVVNGMMGGGFLKNFIVEIDYTQKELKIWNPKYFRRARLKKYKLYDLELPDDKCFATFNVTANGKSAPMKFLIDSGLSTPLWVDIRTGTTIAPSATSIYSYLGYGLNGDIYGQVSRIPSIGIGGFSFKKIIAAFPDTAYIGSVSNLNNRHGSIGSDILRRFTVLLNYPEKKIGLRPNSSYRSPFFLDMSGIEIGSVLPGFPGYRILTVRSGSPAEKVGLRVGDQIVSVNDKLAITIKMSELLEILNGKKGTTIHMEVLRDGGLVKVRFVLKDVI